MWSLMTWIPTALTSPVNCTRWGTRNTPYVGTCQCLGTVSKLCSALALCPVHILSSGGRVQRHGVREEEGHLPRGQFHGSLWYEQSLW